MKVLIVSNCNGQAHYKFMKHFFPDWDVRLVVFSQARQWMFDEHEGFMDFLGQADLFMGTPQFTDDTAEGFFKPTFISLPVPGFVYTGTRPDCCFVPRVTSPTGGGILHSRIALSAFCSGKSVEQTAALFTHEHYKKLGYYGEHQRDYTRNYHLLRPLGIDIETLFQTWWDEGDFMYTPNHPSGRVLYDLLRHGLAARDLLKGISRDELDRMRGRFDDPLSRGILWPVYPEIAERWKVVAPITHWRGSIALGQGGNFDLQEMLNRSFATYAEWDDIQERAEKVLGSVNIPIYAGDAPPEKRLVRDFRWTFWDRVSPRRRLRRIRNRFMGRPRPIVVKETA